MKSNIINIFTRQYLSVPEPEQVPVVEDKPKRKRKPKNQPAELSKDRAEHNEAVKRQYGLT